VLRTTPIELVKHGPLVCSGGAHTDYVPQVGPLDAAGTYWVAVTGSDGHGGKSKYEGNVEHPVEPALASFTIPSATSIAGEAQGGGPYPGAVARSQEWYAALGLVDAPSQLYSDAVFYSARYEYPPSGPVQVGGLLAYPAKEETLDALFEDDIVIYNGHGDDDAIFNRHNCPVTAQDVSDRAGESNAKFVFLRCCFAGETFAPTLHDSGADCVVGFAGLLDSEETGWIEFMHCLCDLGMTVEDAVDQVIRRYPEWDWSGQYPVLVRGDDSRGLWEVPRSWVACG